MKSMFQITDKEENVLQEDTYFNEDNKLMYCSKCHTPRQHRVQWNGKELTPTIRCHCQKEEYEKQEAERNNRNFCCNKSLV